MPGGIRLRAKSSHEQEETEERLVFTDWPGKALRRALFGAESLTIAEGTRISTRTNPELRLHSAVE